MHDGCRLTEYDKDRVAAAINRTLREWAENGNPRIDGGVMLRRIAAHAIGCSLYDLRDVEIQWIDNEIGEHEMGTR